MSSTGRRRKELQDKLNAANANVRRLSQELAELWFKASRLEQRIKRMDERVFTSNQARNNMEIVAIAAYKDGFMECWNCMQDSEAGQSKEEQQNKKLSRVVLWLN